jgi:hypothetical protein
MTQKVHGPLAQLVERLAVNRKVDGSNPSGAALFERLIYFSNRIQDRMNKELSNPSRHILAVASGILGGFLPNKMSNIHPLLMGAILAVFFVKLLFGDYDIGYQWTVRDIIFVIVTALEGSVGAAIAQKSLA